MAKRTPDEIEQAAAEFADRLDWLESAWGGSCEYEVDMETGRAWFRLSVPGSTTSLMVRCMAWSVTLPATPARRNPKKKTDGQG